MNESRQRAGSDPLSVTLVKIYGERNTGTSYLLTLLLRNLEIDCQPGGFPRRLRRLFPRSERARDWYFRATERNNLGWKHAAVPRPETLLRARPDSKRLLFLTLTKNPYAWLLSLHRRPYHARHRFDRLEDFLSERWQTVGRENGPESYRNPIAMWNAKNSGYLALADYATTHHCRYEDLIVDPTRFLDAFCETHGITSRIHPFQNVHEATKRSDRGRTFDDYRDYYMNERWRDELSDECIARINADLDAEVMRRFGYSLIAV